MKLYVCTFLVLLSGVNSFCPPASSRQSTSVVSCRALPTAEESAAALTDFMAKAHEEKLRAMADVEKKYQGRIAELEALVAELEAGTSVIESTSGSSPIVNDGSYLPPATNKDLIDKVESYRKFIAEYIVNSQFDKYNAVKATEAKMKAQYEGIME